MSYGMKRTFLFILNFVLLFFFYFLNSRAQELSEFYFSKSGINAKLDTVSYNEFSKHGTPVSYIEPKTNNKIDSILNGMRVKYPGSIKDSLQYLILYSKTGNHYLRNDSSDPNKMMSYTKLDYKNGFLIFYISHSQGEEYILFNPKSRLLKTVKGYPVFIDANTVYDIGSYDGEYFFQYKTLSNENQVQLISNLWAMQGFYSAGKKFYFEFAKGEKKKWLRVTVI